MVPDEEEKKNPFYWVEKQNTVKDSISSEFPRNREFQKH